MMEWLWNVWMILLVPQGLWMAWSSIRGLKEFSQSRILIDFGLRRLTIGRVLCGLLMAWLPVSIGSSMLKDQLRVSDLALVIWSLSMLVMSIADSIPLAGVYERGMRVPQNFLFSQIVSFVPWDSIKQYQWLEMGRWDEQGRLVLNPGHFQTTCLIPREFILEIDALLKTKCPLLTTLPNSSSPVVERPA